VIGLGRSGRSAVDFLIGLRDAGAPLEVFAVDADDTEALTDVAQGYVSKGVEVRLGARDVDPDWDLVIVSPGVPPTSPLLFSATAADAAVVSEIEVAYGHSQAAFVAVTGTNGKTTTTSLIAHLLVTAGIHAETVGNIDPPALAVAPGAGPDDVMVCEASSFQLAHIRDFHPTVSVLLNVTEDHLDWHGSFERYVSDKARVFENQCASDLAVIVTDDAGAAPFADRVAARGVRVCRVSLSCLEPGGASVVDGVLTVSGSAGPIPLARVGELLLRGEHNVANALAASAAAIEMGADPAMVAMGLRSFAPIEHRLEPVGVVRGVEYVNDSKATNPDAVAKALTAFADRPVVLLLGGRNKGSRFEDLATVLPGRVREVVLFGESGPSIAEQVGHAVGSTTTRGLSEAVAMAARAARKGDVVLLSPGCASFDEFDDYAARGDAFRRIVRDMEETTGDA
jgi:UDP-N-acetylmuramoylalanine--D-glutamate ligase